MENGSPANTKNTYLIDTYDEDHPKVQMVAKLSKMEAHGSGFQASSRDESVMMGQFHMGLRIPLWVNARALFALKFQGLVLPRIQTSKTVLE